MSSTPSKDNALPTLPATRVAPVMVMPGRGVGDESIGAPAASSKPSARTTFAGPDDTTTATLLAGCAKVKAPGVWLMMLPRRIVELGAVVVEIVRLASASNCVAVAVFDVDHVRAPACPARS